PHLSIIGLGDNEYSTNLPPVTFQSQLTTIVAKALLTGSVLLWLEPLRTDVVGTYPWSDYVTAIKAVAVANNIPWLDINDLWGGGITAQGGIYDSGDHVHPNTEGHYTIARAICDVILDA
ncbi:MAG: SGNH/GDSL hydrolase family protein, partial [Candidatus Absconditicoccaceae bacterium]